MEIRLTNRQQSLPDPTWVEDLATVLRFPRSHDYDGGSRGQRALGKFTQHPELRRRGSPHLDSSRRRACLSSSGGNLVFRRRATTQHAAPLSDSCRSRNAGARLANSTRRSPRRHIHSDRHAHRSNSVRVMLAIIYHHAPCTFLGIQSWTWLWVTAVALAPAIFVGTPPNGGATTCPTRSPIF